MKLVYTVLGEIIPSCRWVLFLQGECEKTRLLRNQSSLWRKDNPWTHYPGTEVGGGRVEEWGVGREPATPEFPRRPV